MSQHRKKYSADRKVEILREHLENQVPISDLSRKYHVHVNMIHKWKKQLFEGALDIFSRKHQKDNNHQSTKINQLEDKIQDKNSLIAEILSDNIRFKKKLNGDL